MILNRMALVAVCIGGSAMGQTTVSFESMGWQDLGTSTSTGLVGNFLPGWTSLNHTPDIGVNVFGAPSQTLSGAANDAAIWLNEYDVNGPLPHINEEVGLSLSGFAIGQTYTLSFYATILLHTNFGWDGNNDALDVAISGADISEWDSTILIDTGDNDGLNTWFAQSIEFTAQNGTVGFNFGGGASAPVLDDNATYRIGFDGFNIVPAPSGLAMLAMGGMMAGRRRR